MRFLTALFDTLAGFIQRNPLTVLFLLLLALGAPALFKGVVLFVLYFILAILLLGILTTLLLGWRIRSFRRKMEQSFDPNHTNRHNPFRTGHQTRQQPGEGEVHIYSTSDIPEKKISDRVGDYVDFEETKNR